MKNTKILRSTLFNITILIFALSPLFSCSHKKKSIPIINHSRDFYARPKNIGQNKKSELKNETKIINSDNADDKKISQSRYIIVENGDTLYSIAKKYQTPLRDLIETNNLFAPYFLKSGDKIKIPQPIYYQIKQGDTLYSVSRANQMNMNDIIALNNLTSPYKLTVGQFIKIKHNDETNIADEKKITHANEPSKQNYGEQSKEHKITENVLTNKNNKFSWPIKGVIISKFGPKKGGLYNDGINIKAREGAQVKAAEDGLVAYVGNELKGYGNLVIIKHSGGWITAYAHLSQTLVKRGEKIKQGHIVGKVGATGNVDAPQLYFGLRKGRDAVNPENYL